ncbi:MAG: YjbE family putative metal transport protein [Hyphomicrobiales bacterium]|nr:YjbE family putative metal transport protein [Hyphomicrobiales bacterium]
MQQLWAHAPNLPEVSLLFARLVEIIWVDVLLSGDNAVVIALATRNLGDRQRRAGIWLGGGAALLLRLIFSLVVVELLGLPWLKLLGGLLLAWIAVKLVIDEDDHGSPRQAASLWRAVATIAFADAVMSFDNVLAVVALAQGNIWLIAFGLLASVPLIIAGASLLLRLLERFPVLIWASCALLAFTAADIMLEDPVLAPVLATLAAHMAVQLDMALEALVVIFCLGIAFILDRRA